MGTSVVVDCRILIFLQNYGLSYLSRDSPVCYRRFYYFINCCRALYQSLATSALRQIVRKSNLRMATVLIISVSLLALLVAVLLGIVVELCRDVHQLRDALGILDRPLEIDLGDAVGAPPSSFGLPAPLDTAAAALVLFLSDRCATCHALAAGLSGTVPGPVWIVVESHSPNDGHEFLAKHNLVKAPRVGVDAAGAIAEKLGLRTTPVAFRVSQGRFSGATTVPSSRYLSSIVPTSIRLEPQQTSILKKELSYVQTV